MRITIFKSIKDTAVPFYRDVNVILERIKEGKCKDTIENIRKRTTKRREIYLNNLTCYLFGGEFSNRNDKSILKHSGIICLDFDGFKDASELKQARIKLIKDPYSYSVFTSPSGNGLKVLVKIPEDIPNHTQYFLSLQDYYKMKEFDSTCKNISRVCYESYDPKLHVNKDSSVYDSLVVETPEPLEYKNSAPRLSSRILTK